MNDTETALDLQERLLDEALADGRVELVGATDDGRALFREVSRDDG